MQCLAAAVCASLTSAPEAARASEGEKKDAPPPSPNIELPTLTATAIQPTGRRGVLTVQASLYIRSVALRLKASRAMPRLLDAYVPALQAWAYNLPPGATPNVEALAAALQRATDRILGPGAKVLLGGVMVS